jgi:hypothetical protein
LATEWSPFGRTSWLPFTCTSPIVHYICRKCGQCGLRFKFYTGFQEGNGNFITNSRATLLANLFLKHPRTAFDIYHISYM